MCSQTERINVTKISIPKSSIDSMQSLSRSQWHFFLSRKNNPKFYIEPQKSPNSQSMRRNNKAGRVTPSDKMQSSKPYGTGMKTDTSTKGTESQAQKQTHPYTDK